MKRLTPAVVSWMMVLVVGLLMTAYFAKRLLADQPKPSRIEPSPRVAAKPPQIEFRSVPIATSALAPGTEVTAAHLGPGRVRTDALAPETLLEERSIIGRVVKQPIAAGVPLRFSQLYPPGERPLPALSRGMQAVSATFSGAASIVGGQLRTGQFVDVHLTPALDESNETRFGGGLTLTLFRGVRVLAISRDGVSAHAGGVVTLELTPEQSNVLILARDKGEIDLSLNPECRGVGGVTVKNGDRATLDDILGAQPVAQPVAFVSETYRGISRSTQEFEARKCIENTDLPRVRKP